MPNNVRVTWKLHFSQRDVIYLLLITATCPGCPVFKNIQIAIGVLVGHLGRHHTAARVRRGSGHDPGDIEFHAVAVGAMPR